MARLGLFLEILEGKVMTKDESMNLVWGVYAEYEKKILESLGPTAKSTPTADIVDAALRLTEITISAMALPAEE